MNKLRKFSVNNLIRFGIAFFLVCLGFRSSAQVVIDPGPRLSNPTFSGITHNSAILGGDYSNGFAPGSTLTDMGTVFKTEAGVTASDNPISKSSPSTGSFTHTRSGFPSATKIFFAAYATYSNIFFGVSNTILSPESSFFTLSAPPLSQPDPLAVTASAISTNQIDITFPAFNSITNCRGYVILRNIGSAPDVSSVQDGVAPGGLSLGSSTLEKTVTTSEISYSDINLSPGVNYHYAVIPFNWNGTNTETYNYRTNDAFTTANAITFAATSTITLNGGTQGGGFDNGIEYINFTPNSADALTDANSVSLAQFRVNDLGVDGSATTLTSIKFRFTNFGNLAKVALFQESLTPGLNPDDPIIIDYFKLSEKQVASEDVGFDNLNISALDASTNFQLRATFKPVVTDNQQINITVTEATASPLGSAFNSQNASGAATVDANAINVKQSKLVFSSTEDVFSGVVDITARATGNFGPLSVWAVDNLANIDRDATSPITLSAPSSPAGGAGGTVSSTLARAAASSNLVSGKLTFSEVSISPEGAFTLTANSGSAGVMPATLPVTLTPQGVTITASSLPLISGLPQIPCYRGEFLALTDIVISESVVTDFAVGNKVSFNLLLPPNFVFDKTVTNAPSANGDGISNISPLSYIATDGVNSNIVQFLYTATTQSSSVVNSLTISGLKIKYIGNEDVTDQKIKRFGGSAVQVGNSDTDDRVFGVLSAKNSATIVDFKVGTAEGATSVADTDTQFQKEIKFVKLIPTDGGTNGVFDGEGVFGSVATNYLFSPNSVGEGSYVITYSIVETIGQKCTVSASKVFNVYASTIANLKTKYCVNDVASTNLNVPSDVINKTQFESPTGTFSFYDFVYEYSPGLYYLLGTLENAGKPLSRFYIATNSTTTTVIPIIPIVSPLGAAVLGGTSVFTGISLPRIDFNFRIFYTKFDPLAGESGIPKGNVSTFDPSFDGYLQARRNFRGGQVPVYYRVKNAAGEVRLGFIAYVSLNDLPVVAFSIPKTQFCSNEPAVSLTGVPNASDNSTNDFFTANVSPLSISKPSIWQFDPRLVQNVVVGSPQTVNITYTYKNPTTECVNTSAPTTVTVYAVPDNAFDVTSSLPNLCQGGDAPVLVAGRTSGTGATYKWYKEDGTLIRPGISYRPTSSELDVNVVGETIFNVTQIVPSTSFGCESAPKAYKIQVKEKPSPPTAALAPLCKNETIEAIQPVPTPGATLQWYAGLNSLVPKDPIATANAASATAAELSLSSATPGIYTRYVTQTLNSCESDPREVKVTINDLPNPTVDAVGVADLAKICKTSPAITLRATPSGGTWSGSASQYLDRGQLNPSTSDGLTAGQTYDLVYTSTDAATSCSNAYTLNFTILPSVDPKLSVSNACEGTPFTISNTSTILPETATTTTIASYGWSFLAGDQKSGDTPIAPNGGTYKEPIVSLRTGSINYSMTTSEGCVVSKTQLINVGAVPDFNFSWSNPCQPDGVQFKAEIVSSIYNSSEVTYAWNFAKNGVLTQTGGNGSVKDPLVSYTNVGKDVAELTVAGTKTQQSGLGSANTVCTNTKSKDIFIVPQLPASATNPYNEYFETSNGNWVDAGVNSSWSWIAPPAAGPISTNGLTEKGTKIWKTHNADGNYNAQERSFILSPCVNLSTGNFAKPVLSFDIIASTPSTSVDGLVVQWTNSDDIENDANWKVLGSTTSGKNWYNTTIVSSSPFSPPNGVSNRPKWLRAAYPLDAQIGSANGKVKFRIVFTSGLDGAKGDNVGVAIDNVFIGDRTRISLIENFTNTSLKANPVARDQNTAFNAFGTTATEAVRLQYHTGFPGADPINTQFASVHNPRASFYGIDNSPTVRIDGAFESGPFANWGRDLYTGRTLEPTNIKILQPVYTPAEESGALKIKTSFTTTTSLPKGTYVFTVLAEKTMNDPRFKGQNGEQSFSYVVKDFFPSPAGYRLPNDVVASTSAPATVVLPEFEWSDQGNLSTSGNGAIVVFVQNDPGPNSVKEVLQAYVDNNPLHPSVITATEPGLASLLSFYPVPADNELLISLGEIAPGHTPVVLYDALGKVVHETTIEKGQQSKTVSTQGYAPGVYLIRLETDKGTVRKKVMVAH